jgi:NAD(P)-dependent dehydrogenase (short-subunit alcohol dehydrogenase family)
MGDDGFLKRLNVQVRCHNILGDITWCRGEVVNKDIKEGAPLVHVRIWGENQRNEQTAIGAATVVLPVFLFLASSDSDYVTGQVIGADGGLLA